MPSPPTFTDFTTRVPLARALGYRALERSTTEATLTAPVHPDQLQTESAVHGGVIATLADTAAVWLLYPDLPPGAGLTSIEFKLNFTRPARADAGDLVARARALQRGRSISVCQVEVEQDGRLVAVGLFTYLRLEQPPGDPDNPAPDRAKNEP